MRLSDIKIPLVVVLLCGVSVGWAGDFIYAPRPAEGESAEGVRVREITVKKGDTLSHISKQYSGRGHYYPQILLFNDIRNPHRIRPGQVVRVPLSRKAAQKAQTVSSDPNREHRQPHAATGTAEVSRPPVEKQQPTVHAATRGEKNAYQRAAAAFKKGDCDNAIKLFDDFISRYPSSVFMPEATLDRAECYLKLSSK